MKKITCLFIALMALIALGLGIPALNIARESATIAKFTKIEEANPPLTTDQVTALLGQPSHIDESESTGVKGEAYYYPWQGGKAMQVVFVNGTVFHAGFVPGDKKS